MISAGKADLVGYKHVVFTSFCIPWSTNLSIPRLTSLILLPFPFLSRRLSRSENNGLAVGDVSHAAHKPVLLIVGGYAVES